MYFVISLIDVACHAIEHNNIRNTLHLRENLKLW